MYDNDNYKDVSELLGKTLVNITRVEKDDIIFTTSEGKVYRMYHEQDCCESVRIEDIEGDLNDLIGAPLLQAEIVSNEDYEASWLKEQDTSYMESYSWTFYKFATIKGYVTLRWLGESNGYYSESVDFVKQ
jgi:hypothetical protein